MKATDNERTPLLINNAHRDDSHPPPKARTRPRLRPLYLVFLCGFFVSWSFGMTSVPLLYVFRLMTCDAYYSEHPDAPHPPRDRCALPTIEASTARAVSLLGMSTTVFGLINLFLTRWNIAVTGVKTALAIQVFTPAVRLLIQNIGVATGGSKGIIITQCSQIVTICGGPNGYMLALNTYVTDLARHEERTASLGRLQGCMMFGSAGGMLVGGILADKFNIQTPFQVTFVLFALSTFYVLACLPYVCPGQEEIKQEKQTGLRRVLGPIRTILPSKYLNIDGTITIEYGAIFLAAGAFCAVLATGYIPTLLQLYATDIFGFGTKRNSYLVSSHSFLRGLFLTVLFPRIISFGRSIFDRPTDTTAPTTTTTTTTNNNNNNSSSKASSLKHPRRLSIAQADREDHSETLLPTRSPDDPPPPRHFKFDLYYTRLSLLIDGGLTLLASLVDRGWQMYVLGAVLPFGAGTASASKGVILQMCDPAERTDALSAVALVEMIARLSTMAVFGLVFAAFASIGKTEWVFVCNAAVALAGVGVLSLSRFPREGAVRLTDGTVAPEDGEGQA